MVNFRWLNPSSVCAALPRGNAAARRSCKACSACGRSSGVSKLRLGGGVHGDFMKISWGFHGDFMEISWGKYNWIPITNGFP